MKSCHGANEGLGTPSMGSVSMETDSTDVILVTRVDSSTYDKKIKFLGKEGHSTNYYKLAIVLEEH